MKMNTVSKMTVGCVLAILVMVISSVSYSMIRVNAQITGATRENQISNIPEILACQKLDPSWSPPFPLSDTRLHNSTAAQLFDAKDCWKQLERNPFTGELPAEFPINSNQTK
jgi:hypothetical protein